MREKEIFTGRNTFRDRLRRITEFEEIFVSPESKVLLTSYPIELEEREKAREILLLERLNALLRHAKRTSFYSNYTQQLESLEQFQQLPIVTKKDLIEHLEETLLPIEQLGIQHYQTSGTSGVHLSNRRQSLELRPHFQRAARFFLYAVDDPEKEIFLNLLYYGDRWSGGIGAHQIMTEALLNFVPVGATSPEELVKHWWETRPTGTFISPPWFVHITRELEAKGLLSKLPNLLDRIFYLGEKLTNYQIEYLTGRTIKPNAKIHSIYATTEAGMIGLQVFPGGPLFIVPDAAYIEIVDENGNSLPPGEEGTIVVTSFNRLTQPLIRYNTNDRGRFLRNDELESYRKLGFYAPAIELLGRSNNEFKLGDGFVNGEMIFERVVQELGVPALNWQLLVTTTENGCTKLTLIIETTTDQEQHINLDPTLISNYYPELQEFIRNVELIGVLAPSGMIERIGPANKIRRIIDNR